MNADGSNRTNLISRPGEDPDTAHEMYPAFSPEGKKIAFATSRHFRGGYGTEWEIYLMNADGSNEIRLTDDGGYAPSFSPDGKKIAFAKGPYLFKNGERRPYAQVADIHVMNADGSDETRLTNNSAAVDLPGDGPRTYTEMRAYPAFSPDGIRIAFGQNIRIYDETGAQESYRRRMYSMKADGTDLTTLADGPALDDPPRIDWGPKPGSAAPTNEATRMQETTAIETLVPSGGPNVLLPMAALFLGGGVLGYALMRHAWSSLSH